MTHTTSRSLSRTAALLVALNLITVPLFAQQIRQPQPMVAAQSVAPIATPSVAKSAPVQNTRAIATLRAVPSTAPSAPPVAVVSSEFATSSESFVSSSVTPPEFAGFIDIALGDVHVLAESNVSRIAIGNGKIVSATTVSEKQILLIPDSAGQTTLYVWKKSGKETKYIVRVAPQDLSKRLTEGAALLSGVNGVTTRIVADRLLVEGVTASDVDRSKLETLLKQVPDAINLTTRSEAIEPMVYLDVKVLEFSKKAIDDMGIQWRISGGASVGVIGPFDQGNPPLGSLYNMTGPNNTGQLRLAPRGIGAFQGYFGIATAINANINMLVSNGEAYILAEPKLACRSGGEAKFLAGGEVPIPVSTGLGGTQVTFKEFGVLLNVKPTVNAAGVVSARIRTELSAVDSSISVNNIPGFLTRRTETDVSLQLGQSLFMSGLMNDDANKTIEKVPGAGDMPILGALFRSKAYRQNKTELVIIVTPLLIESDSPVNRTLIQEAMDKRERTKNPDSADVLPPNAPAGRLIPLPRNDKPAASAEHPLADRDLGD